MKGTTNTVTMTNHNATSKLLQRMNASPHWRVRHDVWWVEPVKNLSHDQWEKMSLQIQSTDSADSKMQRHGKSISNCCKKRTTKKTKAMETLPTKQEEEQG